MVDYFGLGSTKKKRKAFPKSVKDLVRKAQGNKCAVCRRSFTTNNRAQYDHKNGKNWDNRAANCQAIHAGCHDRKSRTQSTARAKKAKTKKKSDPFAVDYKNFF